MFNVMSKFKITPRPPPPPDATLTPTLTPERLCSQRVLEGEGETLASLPWIKLVDDALEPDDREKSGAESGQAGQEENAKRQQGLPARRL